MAVKTQPKVTRRKISDYIPDDMNANTGSERGSAMLENSLQKVGAGRSLVADKDGHIVAGNKTLQAAVDAGIADVIEIESDGHSIIVHKRTDFDLSDKKGSAREYAYLDNRVGELSLNWDANVIAADVEAGVDLSGMWTEAEMSYLFQSTSDDWQNALGGLADGDRAPFQQMTFTLHDGQAETVKRAIDTAKSLGAFVDSENENSNGNALARVCELFLGNHG